MSRPTHGVSSPDPFTRIGVGLWTMQSTATRPTSIARRYRDFVDDTVLAERLGLHSVWTAEHRLWYDGWSPMPLHAQAAAAARTSRIRFGNAMLLLPQHDPTRFARTAATLDRLSDGRLDLGVGLGHRDAEFDALGLRRDRRGRLMDEALTTLAQVWSGHDGDRPPAQPGGPALWIGGMALAAIARAARRGHNLMLPQTMFPEQVRAIADQYRRQARRPGLVGVLRDTWIEADPHRARAFEAQVRLRFHEEAGGWWLLKGRPGFFAPEQIQRQLDRISSAAVIGAPSLVVERLDELFAAGADFLSLRFNFDFVDPTELRLKLRELAELVIPRLHPIQRDGAPR